MKQPKPWYRASKSAWYVEHNFKQHRLGEHPDGAPPPKKSKSGWNAPKEGSPEVAGLPLLLQNSQYACIIDKDSGAWYAVAPGRFFHLKNFVEVNALRDSGILTRGQVFFDHAGVELVRALVLRTDNSELLPVPPPATYIVKAGDSFNAIAKSLNVTPDALAAANPLVKDRNSITKDQVLNVPK